MRKKAIWDAHLEMQEREFDKDERERRNGNVDRETSQENFV